ncbi:hypothetical protein, partial [Draconibacterium sp.]|uniref:hypothetical protein n=1 Tax=Draconibacterium sp. TaxID=1965318 RepID=UPI003569393E
MRLLSIIFCFCCIAKLALGQSITIDSLKQEYDKQYGLNSILINGKKSSTYYLDHYGHPFWRSDKEFWADIFLESKRFEAQRVKYNIEKQEFILNFTNLNGAEKQIILTPSIVDTIVINEYIFIPNTNKKIKPAYVQLIYSNKVKCTKGWYKNLVVAKDVSSRSGFKYQKEQVEWYLEGEGST